MLIASHKQPLLSKHQGFLYQVQAVEAIRKHEYAAIFHEQGLGKTKIAIDLCLAWLKDDVIDSVIFVTKKSLIRNWQEELEVHSFLRPRLLTQDKAANYFAFNSPARVYLTHYEVMKAESKRLSLFLKTRRVAVFLDESQKIKNPNSEVAKAVLALSQGFKRRVIMTGTPVANRPYDLWAQIYFLDNGKALGSEYKEFQRTLDLSNDLSEDEQERSKFEQSLSEVFSKISSFSVRETKLSTGIDLPDKHISNIQVEMESRQEEIYKRYRNELASIVVRSGKPVLDDAEEMLKRLLRLVQVASNPALVDDSYQRCPGKFQVLQNLIYDAVDSGSKVIVWTSFIENVDWLSCELSVFRPVKVYGKMAIANRNDSINTFKNDDSCRVLIATPASAKEGLTLTVANHAIFYDRSFSLDDYLQAQDRIHRISQKQPCFIYNLIAHHTIDEWVDVLLAAKHLAAQLGQGDIDKATYLDRASYDYGVMIREILGIEEKSSVSH